MGRRNRHWSLKWTTLILFIFTWILKFGSSFVVITDQNKIDGWILFDSQIRLPPETISPELSSINSTQWHYQYRVSHHKTQPWVHKIVHLNKDGQLMFRRSYAHKCQMSQIFPSTFLVYIDIIAKSSLPQNYPKQSSEDFSRPNDGHQLKNELARQFYDYISFPITVILQESDECKQRSAEKAEQDPPTNELTTESSISRTVDDIYVSLPIDYEDRCFHSSEKIGNVLDFLPTSVRKQCSVAAHVISSEEHTWAIEMSTNDIVLKRDWCLFEPYHTIQLVLHLNCSKEFEMLPESVIAWDQMVHLILHTVGGIGSSSQSSGHMDSHPIHRIRREMRNQSPYFDQPLYIAAIPEEQQPGITVTTITASDPENSPLTYSMTSLLDARSQQFFTLDSKSGIVTTIEKLDREKMDVHYFRIVATDSGIPPRTGTGTLQINVIDVNDFGPLFEHASYSVSVREGISVGSTVLSVRATDQDIEKNGDILYSILNQHDIDMFRIDPSSGVITTKLALDREKRDEYTLIVQATDLAPSQNDRKSATATVRVEVLDDNDNWPQWTQRSYNVTIPENFDISNYPVIARVSATDADEGVNSALRYSIIGGNTKNIFSIDSLTGEVSLTKALDYEATRSYRLNIRAIDNGNPTRSNNTQLLVQVADINDNIPRFYSQIFQETVLENLPTSSSVLRVQAFDSDDGDNAKIFYRLSYRENEKFPFDIEPDSGWIKTNRELDREDQSRYDFEVIAADSGDNPLSATASVVITVSDFNDNDPKFEPKLYEAQVSELDPPGTPVVTVKATDPDENSRLIYEIAEGNVRSRFSITTQNGEGIMTIAQPLDFKSERKYVLTVRVTDSGGKIDLATVYVDVMDANTNAPQFQNTPYSVKIFEDVPIGTTVLTVTAFDQDSGQNAQIIYTFVNEGDETDSDNSAFMIDSTTGAITTSQLLDREKIPGYILTVTARDRGIPPMSDTTDVEIVLNDVNDQVPTFTNEYNVKSIDEDVPIGTSILQVAATDGDIGKNSIIRYSFSTFSDGDGTFKVDPSSGIIRTIKPLDREQVSRYDLMVLATDQGSPQLTGRTNVSINVLDKNDSPPQFESDRIRLFIQENSPIGAVVGTLKAWDQDEGQNAQIIFSIVGGADANSFTLVSHPQPTGEGVSGTAATASADILTRIELDYESPRKKYDIHVRAASPPLRNDVHVEIHVVDVNDNAPMIKPQFYVILNNYKDHFPVGPIGQVPAIDADISDKLQYSIVSGNKANLVYLNETTGLITLSPYLDTNVPLNAKMEVLVSDGLNEVRSEMILHTRMITDELLFNSVTIQLADMTTEAFLSPLFNHFLQAVAVILNVPKENIVIFSVQEEIEGTHGSLNVSLSAKKPSSTTEEYFSPDYIKERVFLNRLTLSKLATVDVLPFSDDLCLQEPCLNFEECLVVLKFRNVSNFILTDSMLFRSVHPWQTFACRCPIGFTGLREHYLCDAEINLCFSSPCRNGGTCYQRERGYSCICPPGFTGPSCEIQLELDTCQPNICGGGSSCTPRVRGGFLCQNCTRGEYVNSLCELTARSFSRGSFLTFPGLKDRVRLHLEISFATQQRNGLLLYNGRYNERFDFIALEIVNSTVRFSFSLGSNVSIVETGKSVSDGLWHTVSVHYISQTATVSVDNCDVIVSLENPEEFPPAKSCAGRGLQILEDRCYSLTESCQRFLDLTGPLYIGGLPAPNSPHQIQSHDFMGCVKNVLINQKFLDLNNFVMEHGTSTGCPEKKSFCASQPCKNGGKCTDGWGTFSCQCPDGFGQKDCSEDAKPVWNLRDENSYISFTPQLRQIQFPWYNSVSLRTLKQSGRLMTVRLSNNESLYITLDNGLVQYYYNDQSIPVTLPRMNDGHWHNIEAKWMTAEIWFSLDFGQFEVTVPFEAKMQSLHVTNVMMGASESAVSGCIQDVRVGGAKNYLRKTTSEKNVNEGCSLATACIGAVCPPRSFCQEEGGRHKCKCDPGYVGISCLPICEQFKPCKNNGTCILDLTKPKGYRCQCDERFYNGYNCENVMEQTCPTTWWGSLGACGPCACPADKNFSPECNKKNGQCKCKEHHYERDGVCKDCQCYGIGSISKNCDLDTGRCQCRSSVVGSKCDSCSNPFAEVTTKGCEVVRDGCPRAFASDIWWPRTKFSTVSVHDCPNGAVGLASRSCETPEGWQTADLFNCTSNSFISIVNIVSQLDTKDLSLTPLLSTKLASDLTKALNTSHKLYGNDLWISLRLLTHLIAHETKQTGLNLSHRQDKNFIKNIVTSVGKVTSRDYVSEWERLRRTYGSGSDTLLALMEKYLAHLVLNQEDTFTKPFEIISPNLVMGLDTIELTWENEGKKNFEDLVVESNYDLYEVTSITKRAVRFPKYDNIVMDPRRYTKNFKVVIPLDILGLNDEKDMAGNAVVGFTEYYSLWDVMPKKFLGDVDRRYNSELIASPPIVSLSILASRLGLVSGRQSSPIRLTYEIHGRYIDSSNPQCVVWSNEGFNNKASSIISSAIVDTPVSSTDGGGWTSRPCQTQVEEVYVTKVGNVMTVNCTCWHLSTFAVLIENKDTQDIPRAGMIEDIVTYVSFVVALMLIFGALIGLGLLQGPVPSTITNTIHKHLLLSIFFSLLFYLVALKLRLILVTNDNICRGIAIGLHLTWLSTFSWLWATAIHLRRMFTEVRDVNHGSSFAYFALGYAFPLLCVALSLGVRANHYGNQFFCWLSLHEGIVWGMVGPILICVIATLVTFLIAVKASFTLKDQVVDSGNMRTLLWMDLTLLPICGMVWALCLLGANERNPIWQFSIAIAVAVLSTYIALGYCVLNQRVKDSFFLRTGGLFRSTAAPQNASRSALAYRTDLGAGGLRRDDPRKKDLFRTARSGVSTASTTSRSTTKTSSSPYGYGATLPHYRVKYGDEIDRKHHIKRRKRANSDDEGSSDGERTLELASSHSSDEDEATAIHGPVRSATLGAHRYPHYRLVPNGHNGHPHSPNSRHKLVSASLSTLHVPATQKPPALPRLYSTHWTPNIFTPPTYREFSSNLRGGGTCGGGTMLSSGTAAPSSGSDNENSLNNYKYPVTDEHGDEDQSSQHEGQNQSSSYHPMYVQQQKELNSSENIGHGHPHQYQLQQEGRLTSFSNQGAVDEVNDLSAGSPNLGSFARLASPVDRYHYPVTYGITSGPGRPLRADESSPLQELPPHLSSFHHHSQAEIKSDDDRGQINRAMDPPSGDEDQHRPISPHYHYPRQPSVQVVPMSMSSGESGSGGRVMILDDRPPSTAPASPPDIQQDDDDNNSEIYGGSTVSGPGVLV